jgi:hypothetical protein
MYASDSALKERAARAAEILGSVGSLAMGNSSAFQHSGKWTGDSTLCPASHSIQWRAGLQEEKVVVVWHIVIRLARDDGDLRVEYRHCKYKISTFVGYC